MTTTVGILALQGAYHKHEKALARLGIKSLLIRQSTALEQCDALILPGGESTTMSLLLQQNTLFSAIKTFAENKPVMGICAGLIMMAAEVDDPRITPLALLPFKARRNFYGRQINSFSANIDLDFDNEKFDATFIRAPGLEKLDTKLKVLATHNGQAIMITDDKHMALAFHPELSNDTRIHEYWLKRH